MGQKSCKGCKYLEDDTWSQCRTCDNYAKWTPAALTQKELEEKLAFEFSKFTKGSNGTTKEDIPVKQKVEQFLKDKNVFLEREKDYDVVSKPKHYMLFDEMEVKERAFEGQGVEVRDVIEKLVGKFSPQESGMFISDYVQMMQYLMRFMDKNGVEDLKKARWYLDKMIQSY